MIETAIYKRILDDGLLLDHYAILRAINEGKALLKSKRIQGFINLLCKKGYIEDGALTDKAISLIEDKLVVTGTKPTIIFEQLPESSIQEKATYDYGEWVIELHRACQQKLKKAMGKTQVKAMVEGKSYPFMPNSTDMGSVLLRAIKHYHLKDFAKIQQTILKYIDKCIKENHWTPLLNYYILKGAGKNVVSTMVTDLEMGDDEPQIDTNVNF